jgi:hypothetical protein
LRKRFLFLATHSSSSIVRPILILPAIIAIVAGIAPVAIIVYSTATAVSLLVGYSMPCVMIVDSNATTGRLLSNAMAICGKISKGRLECIFYNK